jgi:putative addiction module component (TIGR02574 family)
MSREVEKILEDALQLPPEARAAVAGRLIESLDVEIDENAEAAWSAEISRRLVDFDSGGIKTVSWEEARRLILGSKDAAARR